MSPIPGIIEYLRSEANQRAWPGNSLLLSLGRLRFYSSRLPSLVKQRDPSQPMLTFPICLKPNMSLN